jgi:hypothetical protein
MSTRKNSSTTNYYSIKYSGTYSFYKNRTKACKNTRRGYSNVTTEDPHIKF